MIYSSALGYSQGCPAHYSLSLKDSYMIACFLFLSIVQTCSRGTACNFLHCFENPRREYEWADVDRPPPRFWQRKVANLFGYAPISGEDFDERQEKSRTHRESTHDNERGRHRDDRELTYDDDRRKDRHSRATEDDQRGGRGDRERKFYEDEMKDRIRRGSKSDDRQRVRHSKESSYDSRRRDSTYDEDDNHSHRRRRDSTYDDDPARDKSTSRSRYCDDQGSINDERWSPGDDYGQTCDKELVHYRDRRRDRRHREPTQDEDDEDNDDDHHSHRRSHHHRSRRRSSPGSHKTRRSRSRDRSTSHRARSQDGNYSSSEEQEYLSSKKERPSKESKRHRHDSPVGSHTVERREDEDGQRHRKRRHSSRERWSYPESEHQHSVKVLEADDTTRHVKDLEPIVAGLASDENTDGSPRKWEADSGLKAGVEVENLNQGVDTNSNSTVTGLSLELFTDEVQKSTSQWQSWKKTKSKKAKLGLKEAPMRIII